MNQMSEIQKRTSTIPNLERLTNLEIEKLLDEFPSLPLQYLDFLKSVGYGDLEELRLYSGPVRPSDIYSKPQGELSSIILFGDDFQGYCFGFDTSKDYSVVEVDPRGNPRLRKENDFLSLITTYLVE
jgi:hypothetical protein